MQVTLICNTLLSLLLSLVLFSSLHSALRYKDPQGLQDYLIIQIYLAWATFIKV